MTGLPAWLMERRAARVALLAVLFPLPLALVISAAIAVLITNVKGWRAALADCGLALLLLLGLATMAGTGWLELGSGAALTWLVAILLGALRSQMSLTLAVQAAVLLGVAAAVGFTLWIQDPQAYWERVLTDLAQRADSAGLNVGPADLVPGAAQVMTGMMSASAVTSSVVALFLGCAWSGTAHGRDFGSEFRQLRMGRTLSLATAGTALLLATGLRGTADDLLLVFASGFVLQGLSLVHWHGFVRRWPRLWSLALYLPMALLPAVAVLELLGLAVIGLADNIVNLRRNGREVV